MAEVSLDQVGKTYENDVVAVHDATFTVADRDFVVLVGPSGCGKSTVLRMIAGLETVTEGTIRIDGKVVNDVAPRDRDIAMVFQNYALYPHMSVFDNMAMGLKIRKTPRAEIRTRVADAARLLGIDELLDRRPRQLSGGQRQRVALGRAIVRRPRAFLFDEPLSNLDAKLRVETRTELSRLHRDLQATMIYVTHDQTEAMTMGNQIVVLRDGHVQQIATPLELYNRPRNRFVASFLGSPPMNFWPARLEMDDGPHLRLGTALRAPVQGTLPDDLATLGGRDLVLGLRPEDMHLGGEPDRLRLFAEVSVTLDVIEPLGSETLLYWSAQDTRGVARVAPTEALEAGARVDLLADLRHAHLFDPQTEATVLSWPGVSP